MQMQTKEPYNRCVETWQTDLEIGIGEPSLQERTIDEQLLAY